MKIDFTDPGFWATFVRDNWEKKELAAENVFRSGPLEEASLFNTVVKCAQVGHPLVLIRIYAGLKKQPFYPGHELYPRESDKSFTGYHERVSRMLNGEKYCLMINFLEVFSYDLWNLGREFLHGLYEKTGFNKLGTFCTLFIGDYDKTPFGVHQDMQSVFHIPLIGKKAMRLWPVEYVKTHPGIAGIVDYKEYVQDSVKIEAGPGGMIYWPSEVWHASEKANDFSVSMAISLNLTRNVTLELLAAMVEHAKNTPGLFSSDTLPVDFNAPEKAHVLPGDILVAQQFIRYAASDLVLQREWLKITSGYNFSVVPDPVPVDSGSIGPDLLISGNAMFPVLFFESGEELNIAANGHLSVYQKSDGLLNAIRMLNTGKPVKVSSLLNGGDKETVLAFLSFLKGVYALSAEQETPVAVE